MNCSSNVWPLLMPCDVNRSNYFGQPSKQNKLCKCWMEQSNLQRHKRTGFFCHGEMDEKLLTPSQELEGTYVLRLLLTLRQTHWFCSSRSTMSRTRAQRAIFRGRLWADQRSKDGSVVHKHCFKRHTGTLVCQSLSHPSDAITENVFVPVWVLK